MMPAKYTKLDRSESVFDLDIAYAVIRGYSKQKPTWTCNVVFDSESQSFIELRSSPPDIRGNCGDEAIELKNPDDLIAYGLSLDEITSIIDNPSNWKTMNYR
tara:strand:- start:351 stop:656 length:306 start_codon:yes stop_codon:yes gene_type:complete